VRLSALGFGQLLSSSYITFFSSDWRKIKHNLFYHIWPLISSKKICPSLSLSRTSFLFELLILSWVNHHYNLLLSLISCHYCLLSTWYWSAVHVSLPLSHDTPLELEKVLWKLITFKLWKPTRNPFKHDVTWSYVIILWFIWALDMPCEKSWSCFSFWPTSPRLKMLIPLFKPSPLDKKCFYVCYMWRQWHLHSPFALCSLPFPQRDWYFVVWSELYDEMMVQVEWKSGVEWPNSTLWPRPQIWSL